MNRTFSTDRCLSSLFPWKNCEHVERNTMEGLGMAASLIHPLPFNQVWEQFLSFPGIDPFPGPLLAEEKLKMLSQGVRIEI